MKSLLVVLTLFFASNEAQAQGILSDDSIIWTAHDQGIAYTKDTVGWITNEVEKLVVGKLTLSGIYQYFGLAYDYRVKELVTSHPDPNIITIVFLDEGRAVPFYFGTSIDVGQLTIDWTARNLYWADGGFGWIGMKNLPSSSTFNSLSQSFKLVVDTQLDKPTGITVYPDGFYLFWSDAGVNPKIERSNLVGDERTTITWYNLITPTCLTIDVSVNQNRLYWSDRSRGTIEYSDFDGNGRTVLASHPELDYYGIVVFQENLIFTAPNQNITGFYSLNENILGRIGKLQTLQYPAYFVDVYDAQAQPREVSEGCDLNKCDQICLHAEMDRGFTCYCTDGYILNRGDGETCDADGAILERHLLYTNGPSICSIGINIITGVSLTADCGVINHVQDIRVFSLDMENNQVYFASGASIFSAEAYELVSKELLSDSEEIIDMDFDWKSKELYWIVAGGSMIHYIDTSTNDSTNNSGTMDIQVTNIAVDPQNRNVYWIGVLNQEYSLHVWHRNTDTNEVINAVHLENPTDLEYHRPSNRLFWNDASGHVGALETDGSNSETFLTLTTGSERHAVTVYKKFILSTNAEPDRHLDAIYERTPNSVQHLTMPDQNSPIMDMHVFAMTLQPLDPEPCELDNGGCDQICIPENTRRCSCYLGYSLQVDDVSCMPTTLPTNTNYLMALDDLNLNVQQVAITANTNDIRAITMHEDNEPSSIAFNADRDMLVWMDQRTKRVKRKHLQDSKEYAVGSNVQTNAKVAIDVTNGNIFVTSGRKIKIIDQYENEKTLLGESDIVETLGHIELLAEKGLMAWIETGSRSRLVMAFMSGDSIRVIRDSQDDSDAIVQPEDLAFDHETNAHLYWCDSELGKIEQVELESFITSTVYVDINVNPVALDVAGESIYFVPQYERKVWSIKKDGTGGPSLIMESPLFGSLSYIIVSQATVPKGHGLCSNCNGGCSTLCLPRGQDSRVCACEDGSELVDLRTCRTAERCPNPTAEGLERFDNCCPDQPRTECQPKCLADYTLKYSIVKCIGGQWNVSLNILCEDSGGDDGTPIPLIAGAAGGGAAVLIIVIVVIVVVCRRRNTKSRKSTTRRPTLPDIHEINGGLANGRHPYDMGDGPASPEQPARNLTSEEEADGGEYMYLDESQIAKRVDLPEKDDKVGIGKHRKSSKRYSNFPGKKDPGYDYLTASNQFPPAPDYPVEGFDNPGVEEDGYLAASVVSGRSNFSDESLNLEFLNKRRSDDGYLAASSIGGYSNGGSDFSDMGYRDYREWNESKRKQMRSVARDANNEPMEVPMAHYNYRGSGSGSGQSASSHYQTSLSGR